MGKGKARWDKKSGYKPHKGDPPDNVHQWFGQYFCGCGYSDEAIAALREVLDIYQEREDFVAVNLDKLKAFEEKHSRGFAMMLLYFMDGTGITEHGGSVYGAWMTNLGKDLKGFLDENPDYEP
jgi:hypothetical protein